MVRSPRRWGFWIALVSPRAILTHSSFLIPMRRMRYIISGSLGQSHQMKAMASGKCKLADLGSDEEIQNVINRLPYYYEYTIPSGTYPNQESDVKTVATGTLLIVNESISDDLVYEITKNLFENVDTLVQSQDIAKEITLESGINVSGLPLHPGAERYYKEKGVLK